MKKSLVPSGEYHHGNTAWKFSKATIKPTQLINQWRSTTTGRNQLDSCTSMYVLVIDSVLMPVFKPNSVHLLTG